MDWKLLASSFSLIFLAELGDKTQRATLALAAGGRSRLTIFAGAALALVGAIAIAVLAGEAVARVVPEVWIKRVAGLGFLVLGTLFLVGKA